MYVNVNDVKYIDRKFHAALLLYRWLDFFPCPVEWKWYAIAPVTILNSVFLFFSFPFLSLVRSSALQMQFDVFYVT